jgi:CheY-like chemotaxis protein
MQPLCLVLSDDLLDGSRIVGEARAAGWTAIQCRDSANLLLALGQSPRLVVLDLHNPGLDVATVVDAAKAASIRVIGFGSHVDAARLKAARAAGCSDVMPRSAFFQDLATKLKDWLPQST